MPLELKRRLISVEEYHRMGEVGILQENGLELINGEILEMSPIGSKHAATVELLRDVLQRNLTDEVLLRTQNPIFLDELNEPEPDIAVVTYRADYYMHQHPRSEDTHLLIEVASSSLEFDREIKVPLYAKAGIPELWIIDVDAQRVEVYYTPSGSAYLHTTVFGVSDTIQAQQISLSIPLEQVFL